MTIMDVLFRNKPFEFYIGIVENGKVKSTHRICMDIDLTYSHAVKLLKKFKESGLVYIEKKGRLNVVIITPKGKKVYDKMILLRGELMK